ncbi:MAG: hypothetical protein KME13_25355, partial [Myxacorys californica WJT36-NPBG1]|nr:hypothetical protein [Myxacorys californica WJT36-NPBG1]
GGLCITTAPTKRQVIELLWGEIRKTHGKKNLPGERGQTFLRVSEEARAFGFTASDTNSNAFQGVHHEYLLVIEDEACGISNEIDEGASSCATGANNRFLRIGNPIETGGSFEKACKRKHIRIPVWDHPNVAWAYQPDSEGVCRLKPEVRAVICNEEGEVLPPLQWAEWCPQDKIPGAVSIGWIEEARSKYGEGSAYWQSRVEGFFPEDSSQSVIPRSYFIAARRRYDADPAYWNAQAKPHDSRFGLDVGDGVDEHARSRWQGAILYSIKAVPTKGDMQDSSRATALAVEGLKEYPGTITVDRGGGFGSGPLDSLLEQGYAAGGVHWGQAAENSAEYLNAKAEDFWNLREAMRKGEVAIAPLGDLEERAMEDLAGVYYESTSTGKIRIEDKEKTKKRLHRSPDVGDAIVIGFRNASGAAWWSAI